MKTYKVEWEETVTMMCAVEIKANSKKEALEKWENGEFEDYQREEFTNEFDDRAFVTEIENEEHKQ